jgi:hypothetical protein
LLRGHVERYGIKEGRTVAKEGEIRRNILDQKRSDMRSHTWFRKDPIMVAPMVDAPVPTPPVNDSVTDVPDTIEEEIREPDC